MSAPEIIWNEGQQRIINEVLQSGARNCLVYGGSRSGKTFLLTSTIIGRALSAPGSRHLIVRRTAKAVKESVGMDTLPKACDLVYGMRPHWHKQDGYFEFPNGSEIWIGGLDDAAAMEKVLGKEYVTIYENEASEIPYSGHTLLRTRLAQKVATQSGPELSQRCYIDLNPTNRAHWTYRMFVEGVDPDSERPLKREQYAVGYVQPVENAANLTVEYLDELEHLPERERRRFFLGEFAGDVPGALWKREFFKRIWHDGEGNLPVEMRRIVVAIDPAATNTELSSETGIIVAAVDANGQGYVLADESGKYDPDEWALKVAAAYEMFGADRVIGEVNNGGDMIEAVLRAHSPHIPYRAVRATRGKVVRAEPVAALYELGKVHHLGELTDLEDQCCSVTTAFDPRVQGWSPDRVDALVWAMTDLFPTITRQKADIGRRRRVGDAMAA